MFTISPYRNIMKLLSLGSLLAVSVVLAGCGGHPAAEKKAVAREPVAVDTAVAREETLTATESVVGTVRPKLEATLSAKIAGRILELAVVPGQKVKAGQLVAVLEAGELEAARNRAAAALEQANRELERQRQLLAASATSRALFDQAEAAQRMAAAGLAEITTTLENARVTAPFAGTISRKLADTGDLAVPGKGIVQLEDPTNLRLETAVPESLAGKLALGQPIPVTLDAVGKQLAATVGELSPSADTASRTFFVKLDLPATEGLRPGLFGRAAFPRGERVALLMPSAALKRMGQMESVFTNENGIARLRLVRTVPAAAGNLEVLSGLENGAVLVLNPPATLVDGTPLLKR